MGIPAFPAWECLPKMGIFCRNSSKTWELQFGAQVGIPAGLLMGTACPGGAQDLGNVGLAHPECSVKGTLGLISNWGIDLPGGSSRLIPVGLFPFHQFQSGFFLFRFLPCPDVSQIFTFLLFLLFPGSRGNCPFFPHFSNNFKILGIHPGPGSSNPCCQLCWEWGGIQPPEAHPNPRFWEVLSHFPWRSCSTQEGSVAVNPGGGGSHPKAAGMWEGWEGIPFLSWLHTQDCRSWSRSWS